MVLEGRDGARDGVPSARRVDTFKRVSLLLPKLDSLLPLQHNH